MARRGRDEKDIGRGSRLAPDYDKLAFEIIDFTGATALFEDPDFDGPADIQVKDEIDDEGAQDRACAWRDRSCLIMREGSVPRRYTTPAAFRAALESRLSAAASAGAVDIGRLRRQVAFERLLARFSARESSTWVL